MSVSFLSSGKRTKLYELAQAHAASLRSSSNTDTNDIPYRWGNRKERRTKVAIERRAPEAERVKAARKAYDEDVLLAIAEYGHHEKAIIAQRVARRQELAHSKAIAQRLRERQLHNRV
jgi:hypothetical protein